MTTSIFQNQAEFNCSHPLQSKWTLWYDDGNQIKLNPKLSWKENLHKVYTISTIEEFWSIYKLLKPPSEIPASANYHLFKQGIEPMWEDKANQKGGKWTFTHPKHKRGPELDNYWLSTISQIMCEDFDTGDITGVVVSIRKGQDRISIWTKKSDESVLKIGFH